VQAFAARWATSTASPTAFNAWYLSERSLLFAPPHKHIRPMDLKVGLKYPLLHCLTTALSEKVLLFLDMVIAVLWSHPRPCLQ
jgi:hypothetical protein